MDDYMLMNALSSLNNTLANNANVVLASKTSSDDRAFSREMTANAWQHNIDMWNMQNEYNLPTNQYSRQIEGLLANGLNPNLVYGNSSSVSGAAGAFPSYHFDGYHSTAVPQFRGINPINDLLSTKLMQTQIATQEAQADYIRARADNELARLPGLTAKSEEASARWNYIFNNMDDQQAAWRAEQSLAYWKGQQAFSNAEILKNKASISYYEAAMAEWLNTTSVPGTDYTYQQYMERYKSMLPAGQFARLKADSLNIASLIAYRRKQGQLLDLKQEYQRYVNQFAKYGRSIGNDWASTLLSGLLWIFNHDDEEMFGPKSLNTPAGGDPYLFDDIEAIEREVEQERKR